MKSGVFFQALNTPKLAGGAYDAPPGLLVGWGGGHPIPFPKLLQPQLLNNLLSGLTLFFINMKQRLWTISVNTRYRVIFACLYCKSQGISCGLESGHPVKGGSLYTLLLRFC